MTVFDSQTNVSNMPWYDIIIIWPELGIKEISFLGHVDTKVEINLINSLIPFYHEGFKYDENTKVKKGGQSFCTSRLVLTSCEKEATV